MPDEHLCDSCVHDEYDCVMNPQGKTETCIKYKRREGPATVTVPDHKGAVKMHNTEMNQTRLYGLKDQETLQDDLGVVIDNLLDDNCDIAGESFDTIADRIAWPVKVYVYRRKELPPARRIADWILDHVYERLDEDYADPDAAGKSNSPTENIRKDTLSLAEVIREEYTPCACEPTGEVIQVSREQARDITGETHA